MKISRMESVKSISVEIYKSVLENFSHDLIVENHFLDSMDLKVMFGIAKDNYTKMLYNIKEEYQIPEKEIPIIIEQSVDLAETLLRKYVRDNSL